ncbi:glutathione S-transferase family protein [Pelomonas sp. Root1237]|uniref:glutathione S-transferase family protein n=1 Tax=Pelomonas sp. Root1237 TaxID=1736434 RepID=UPI0006F4454F|nr:glutathione S-transferase family protein [Pelomonas sp. Root1237]KQV88399.1 glutathione S-transferase [Pelomonas sp. Root1237]
MTALTLISHALCPYVQRAAIVLKEKSVAFERLDVDLANKPDWFLHLSPLGKTPVLCVGREALFESAVICEYLDETRPPRLHPQDPLARARERAWMEFGSAVLSGIAVLYSAADDASLERAYAALRLRFEQVEAVLGDGPWFAGRRFGLVDAVFGPVFRYFAVIPPEGLFDGLPRVQAWREALAGRPSVREAVAPGYAQRLRDFLLERGCALARRLCTDATNSIPKEITIRPNIQKKI